MPEALSVDAAIGLLDAPEPAPEEAAPVEAQPEASAETPETLEPESPAEPEAEAALDPEEAIEEAPAEEDPEPVPAIDPPRSWDAAEREEFAKLPPSAQAIVVAREAERDARVSKALQESTAARQASDAEVSKVQTLAKQLGEFLPQALKTFETRWGKAPDWAATVAQFGAEKAFELKVQYEQEQQQLGETIRAENEAKAIAFQAFVRAETEKLPTIAPELADPKTGPQLRSDVGRFAVEAGWAKPEDLANVSAAQLSMAHDAMRWRQLSEAQKSALATLKAPKPAAPAPARTPARPAQVRPTAAAPAPSQARATQVAANRFAQTGSIDDALALLNARTG